MPKVDASEVFADARARVGTISLVVLLLIGLAVAITAYVNRRAQAAVFRDLYGAERRAREAQERFRATVYSIGDAVITTDTAGAVREMNRVAEALTGWTEAEAQGRGLDDVFRVISEQTRDAMASPVAAVLRDGRVVELTARTLLVVSRTPDGRPLRLLGTHTDITAQKVADERIRRLSQLYATLSQCSQAIVRSSSDTELFARICRDAVVVGGMKMAWVGVVDAATRMVTPVASYGDEGGYLDRIQVSVSVDHPFGRGPTGTSIRENRPFWCQDVATDAATADFHEAGARAAWASSASLPLCREGTPVGALSLYSGTGQAFDDEARTLLTEMATEISFALDSLAGEAAREVAEQQALAANRQLEAVLDPIPDLMFEIGLDGRYYGYHSPRTDLLAAPPEVFMGRTMSGFLPAAEVDAIMAALREAHRDGFSAGATYQVPLPQGRRWFGGSPVV